MGDRISDLPVDTSELTDEEKTIISTVFQQPPETAQVTDVNNQEIRKDRNVHASLSHANSAHGGSSQSEAGISEIRSLVVAIVLFVIFTRDCVDVMIVRIFPSADVWYYKLAIRTALFAAIYFLLTYFPIFGLKK
jgi:hypothetical protein